jgi:hypothetical protein
VDPELAWVVRWRETGEEPTEGELFIGDSRSKYYWVNREVFVLEKGVLWKKRDEGKSARRVVPEMYREQIVKLYFPVYPIILASRVPYKQFSFSGLLPCLPPPDHPG